MFSRSKSAQPPVAAAPSQENAGAKTLDMIERRKSVRPLPQPDVREGNEPSDWALWESLSRAPSQT